jgi:hypothetical protein
LQKEALGFIVTHMKRGDNILKSTLYDFIVETLLKSRTGERGWAALQEPPRCVDAHTLECIYILCFEAVEKKEDIRHFRTTAACITDAIATLIREKEEVVHAEQWRKRQEEQATERATKQAEQQRKEEIALAMQHGMEGR